MIDARRTALLALSALCEAALLTPAVLMLVSFPAVQRSGAIGGLMLLLLALAVLWRWLGARDVRPQIQYMCMAGAFALLTLAGVGEQRAMNADGRFNYFAYLPALLAALLVFWRGIALGQSALNFADVSQRTQLGVWVFVVVGMIAILLRSTRLLESILPFFVAASCALPLSQLESVSQSNFGRPVKMTAHWWRWIGLMCLSAALLGSVMYALATGTPILSVLLGLIALIAFPIIAVLGLILVPLIEFLRGRLLGFGYQLPERPLLPDAAPTDITALLETFLPSEGTSLFLAVLTFAIVAAVAVLLAGHAQRQRKKAGTLNVIHEGMLEPAAPQRELAPLPAALRSLRRWLAEITVRRLYARMLREAAKRGQARSSAQTPLDMLPKLTAAFPGAEAETRALTDAYLAAHYGEVPDSSEALAGLRAAWARLKNAR